MADAQHPPIASADFGERNPSYSVRRQRPLYGPDASGKNSVKRSLSGDLAPAVNRLPRSDGNTDSASLVQHGSTNGLRRGRSRTRGERNEVKKKEKGPIAHCAQQA